MANGRREDPEVRQLREINRELRNVERNTSPKGWFWQGLLYGAGWIVGSLIAILLLGWILAALGVIPGLNRIVTDLSTAFSRIGR